MALHSCYRPCSLSLVCWEPPALPPLLRYWELLKHSHLTVGLSHEHAELEEDKAWSPVNRFCVCVVCMGGVCTVCAVCLVCVFAVCVVVHVWCMCVVCVCMREYTCLGCVYACTHMCECVCM